MSYSPTKNVGRRGRPWRIAVYFFSFLSILAAWDLVGAYIGAPTSLFPTVRDISVNALLGFGRLGASSQEPSIWIGLLFLCNSAITTTIRILLALAVAIPIGVLFGAVVLRGIPIPYIRLVVLSALNGIPVLALIPLFALWFGDSKLFSIYVYLVFSIGILIATDSYYVVDGIAPEIRNLVSKIGSTYSCFIYFLLPAIWQKIKTSLKQVVALSWAFSVGSETIINKDGLGYLLNQSYMNNNMAQLILIALIYSMLGWFSVQITSALVDKSVYQG